MSNGPLPASDLKDNIFHRYPELPDNLPISTFVSEKCNLFRGIL